MLYICYTLSHVFLADAEDQPRHQPPLPTVTTSGPSDVTEHQSFSHALPRQRPATERSGQQGGKTVTVKAVCRSDIQTQRGGAGDDHNHFVQVIR